MIGWTLCSGIGAPEIGCPEVDWRLASEIEPFPRSVLSARFGHEDRDGAHRRLWGDFTTLDPADSPAPLPDLIVAGTPCQAFSVAGARKGLADPRGNLTLAFVELCHAIAAGRDGGLVAVWENVPGVLSDAENAFGCFLGGLVGADDPLHTPDGGSWPGVGMVAGPRSRVAWRILDAQYFGVAQRRRRVFVVADIGNGADPAAILFERKGLRGNTPPRREAGEDVAADVGAGFEISSGDVAHCLNAGGMGRQDFETETLIATSSGHGWWDADTKAATLRAQDSITKADTLVAFSLRGREGGALPEASPDGMAPALRAADGGSSRAMVAINMQGGKGQASFSEELSHCLGADSQIHAISNGYAVRRLTPRECERLQGFPDDHTAVMHRGKPAADGPRYKALGNSWAVPCGAWVLRRAVAAMKGAA